MTNLPIGENVSDRPIGMTSRCDLDHRQKSCWPKKNESIENGKRLNMAESLFAFRLI